MKSIKRGEVGTAFFITVVLIIIGLVILFIVLSKFIWGSEINKQTCHESVIFRATMPSEIQSYTPLKCKTAKYCLTTKSFGKGECSEFLGVEKEVTTVRVKTKTDIEQFIAREMLDCWSMMGEGKVSLFSQYFAVSYGLGYVYPSCILCSRVAFDSALKSNKIFDEIDLRGYMITHKVPGKDVSYADYFAGENGKITLGGKYSENLEAVLKGRNTITVLVKGLNEDFNNPENKFNDKNTKNAVEGAGSALNVASVNFTERIEKNAQSESAILFMQISAPDGWDSLKNVVGDLFGLGTLGSWLVTGSPFGATRWVVSSTIKHPVAAALIAITGIAVQQGMVAYNRDVTAGYCGDVSVGREARDGCSVVRIVNYDLKGISQYCQAIESVP